jgi:nucleotide-binding universal stress UspA family protein
MDDDTGTVLVGVDGSPNAGSAVDWAAREAVLHGWHLLLLHAQVIDDPYGERLPRIDSESFLPSYLEEHRLRLAQARPQLDVRIEVVRGNPAKVLIQRSSTAVMTVVGARGRSLAERMRLGSVSRHVANHAHSATVVVRDVPAGAGRAVVVGIDDSAHAHEVLAWAAREARLHGSRLVVVHAWEVPVGDPYGAWMPSPDLADALEKEARDVVVEALGAVREDVRDLDVEIRVEHGHPVNVLGRLADTAALLVLGTHGRGWFEGMVAGSVTAAAVHDCACPVLVVPREPA